MVFCSYYTSGVSEGHAAELAESMTKLGLRFSLYALDDAGSFLKNCAQKPQFILDVIGEHPGEGVVFLSPYARVAKTPEKLIEMPIGATFAGYWRDGELFADTLYFDGSVDSAAILSAWRDRCLGAPLVPDYLHLQEVINQIKPRQIRLPEAYCFVAGRWTLEPHEVVILHLEDSRKLVAAAVEA